MPVKKIEDKSLFTEFIIERAAIGLSAKLITGDCYETLHISANPEDIQEIIDKNQNEIYDRKKQLQSEAIAKVPSLISSLNEIVYDARKILAQCKSDDLDNYIKLLNPYLKALELRGKALGEIIEKQITINHMEITQQNINGLEWLESEGIIEIKDKFKLKEILNIN